LEVKPGDQYAINQIAELQKKAATAQIEKDNLQKEGLFDSYVRAGDKALSDKTYEVAATAYTEALKLRPNDSRAVLKLKSVSRQRSADSIAAGAAEKRRIICKFCKCR
jgi:predicted TPR repeat methyltransferase